MSASSNSNNPLSKIKKYLPLFSLILLTVSLLIYFGFEQVDKSVKQTENNLIGDLYSKTLKPLFSNEQITKEDVLNFALYNNLPVNKEENKILQIKDNPSGSEIIEVRKSGIKENTDNYSKFVKKMELNNNQVDELDSLLESFKENITNTIFSDDNKTIAIDSRIGLLHRILRTEIFDFISRVKTKNDFQIAHTESSLRNFNRIIENEKSKSIRNYIFITPDTVLQSDAEFTREDLHREIHKNNLGKSPIIKIIHKDDEIEKRSVNKENKWTYKTDSNLVEVLLTESYFEDLEIEKYDELNTILDSSSNKFNISIGLSNADDMNFSVSTSKTDSIHEIQFEFNLDNLAETITNTIKLPENPSIEDWAEFGIKMDSLALKFQELHLDTLENIEDINP